MQQNNNDDDVKAIFTYLNEVIPHQHDRAIAYLNELVPFKGQDKTIWKNRLGGYVEGLCVMGVLDGHTYTKIHALLFKSEKVRTSRGGRKFKFCVKITTSKMDEFLFDVPSMNPLDAYVQLTKRLAYRTIPDIETVSVYKGEMDKLSTDSQPERAFGKHELVFISQQ